MSRAADQRTDAQRAQAIDERLDALLQVERRLEARVAEAGQQARAELAAAQARARDGAEAEATALARAEAEEEARDRARHERLLSELRVESARELEALAVPEDFLERLARLAVTRTLE